VNDVRGGLALARQFYLDAIRPLVSDIPHAAALLGDGSEVLGFDDEISADHDFGPRLQVFVADPSVIDTVLARLEQLPSTFEGWPVRFSGSDSAESKHHVEVATISGFFAGTLGVGPAAEMSAVDWLLIPTQKLASLTRGAVFHDPFGELAERRSAIEWYPDDVWRYVLAAAWLRISQEDAFVGRTGGRGDELGSRIVAARVARDMMRLAFLTSREYAPYSKWLGLAFAQLPLAAQIGPSLSTALAADDWREREAGLCEAGRLLALATNALGLTAPLDPEPRQFHDRDIRVSAGEEYAVALAATITDPQVLAVLRQQGLRRHTEIGRLTGSVDQFVDSTDVLTDTARCRSFRPLLIRAPI
jgi:Domain of unknown function (DUF4037)